MIEAPQLQYQKEQELQQGSLPPPHSSGSSILHSQSFDAQWDHGQHFLPLATLYPAIHSPRNARVYVWPQQIKVLLQVNGQSVFPDMFSSNFLPLPSPSIPETFAKYSFLAFDNLGFRFLLPAKGFLGRLTDITSPSFKNSPYTGVMSWDLCLS